MDIYKVNGYDEVMWLKQKNTGLVWRCTDHLQPHNKYCRLWFNYQSLFIQSNQRYDIYEMAG